MYRATVIAIAVGFSVKAVLFACAYFAAGAAPLVLMAGHDGAEYLRYAELIGSGATGALPTDVLRHDPGLPLALTGLWLASGKLVSLPACALVLQMGAWLAGVVLFATLCRRWGEGSRCPASVITAAAIGFPAAVYYGQFNLTEPLFVALILGSLVAAASERWLFAFLLAGLSALVRSTGLLLVVALLLAHPAVLQLLRQPRLALGLAGYAAAGLAPWVVSQIVFQLLFETNFSTHKPTFGLPFSGFRGLADAGVFRSVYIIGVIGFFLVSTAGLVVAAKRAQWSDALRNLAIVFAVIFLGFHLCLKTLYYIDQEVWTFDYQDRYLVPLWPLAVLLWWRWITWPVAGALVGGSAVMAGYWMRNYLAAAGM